MSASLSGELQVKYGCRSLPVRKGDKVRIMRGDFKKLEGEVTKVDLKKEALYVEGATVTKVDGTQVQRPIHPSKVAIIELVEDKWRSKILERRSRLG
jgi:large subunit ribosomal protein L24